MLSELRQKHNRYHLLEQHLYQLPENAFDSADSSSPTYDIDGHDIEEDTLRMLFVCCDPSIAAEAQLVFALKTFVAFLSLRYPYVYSPLMPISINV